jgi:DNA-binding GntR family transcriptional regulator
MSPDTQTDAATDALRQRILEGEYGRSGRLPSLNMLAEQLGIGRDTANSVVQRLQAEGLLISKGRAGVFVNQLRPRIPTNIARFERYLEKQGLKAIESDIESPSVVVAPPYVAHALGIAENGLVLHRLRRMGTVTAPYCLVENFYPVELVGDAIVEQAQKDETYDIPLALQEVQGTIAKLVHEDVIGRLPSSKEQHLLEIVHGTPVQEINRVYYTEDGATAIYYSRLTLVARYFVLSYDYTAPPLP